MKRHFMILGLIATAFALVNCTKEIEQPVEAPETNEGIPFEIVASTVGTKTTLDGLQTKWVSNDQISVYHAEANSETYGTNDTFTISSENLESNKFTGTLTEDLFENNDWYVMYPYKSAWKPNTTNGGVVYLGSKYNDEQTQEGNNDMSHLAGVNFPLYGKAKNLPASQSPSIAMSHLTSVIAITVKNKLSDPLTVLNVKFTATEPIIGGYYISIVEEEPVYTGNGQYVNSTATLNVEDATEIAFNGEATYYIGIKPFTATTGQELKISVNGYEKTLHLEENVEFKAGYIKPITFSYDKIYGQQLPYSENFGGTLGLFSIDNKLLGEGLEAVWSTSSGYIQATAYKSSTRYESESWLISPYIDLKAKSSAYLSFEQASGYFADGQAKLKARAEGGEWADLTFTAPLNTGTSNYNSSGYVSLYSYIGKNVQIAFVYTSTTSDAGTWRIKNFKVSETKEQAISFASTSVTATIGSDVAEPALSGAQTTVIYTSSNTSVATVNSSTGEVSLVAAGETTITATAAAENGYPEATASYTLNVISADAKYYVKVTEAPDDWSGNYLLVCESKSMVFSGFYESYGSGANIAITDNKIVSNNTTDSYQLIISKSSTNNGSYVIKYGEKFFSWTSGNSLTGVDEDNVNSNWILEIDQNVNTVINNKSDNTRNLRWNARSPRFACYTSAQTAVQLYRLED